jgi:hypothetical protein
MRTPALARAAVTAALPMIFLFGCEVVGNIGPAGGEPGSFGSSGGSGSSSMGAGGAVTTVASGAGGSKGSTGGTTGAAASGLPCDVQAMLATNCTVCHGSPPIPGVPMSLVTYADLTAPAVTDPTRKVAELCVQRMQSTTMPMPPAPGTPVPASQIAALSSWIAAGYPQGTCGSSGGGADGGAGSGGTPDAGPGPYDTPVTCTSGKTTPNGGGSQTMDPGQACINCHQSTGGEAPLFAIAGTVYPTAHEPDNCNGANGTNGAKVVIVDKNGQSLTLTPNSVGNFSYQGAQGAIATPFTAKVTYMGRERIMTTPQTSGDCNSCHTVSGAMSAPGRIMLP